MDRSPACYVRPIMTWRAVTAASILVILVTSTAFVATVHRQDQGEGALDSTDARRQRRDAEVSTTSKPGRAIFDLLSDKSGNYFPVYREVGGRSVDWDSAQMSTDGFDVQSRTDFVDDDDDEEEYDDESSSADADYDYTADHNCN